MHCVMFWLRSDAGVTPRVISAEQHAESEFVVIVWYIIYYFHNFNIKHNFSHLDKHYVFGFVQGIILILNKA